MRELDAGDAAELVLSAVGPWLTGILRGLLAAEAAGGRCPFGGVRVQGGSAVTPQERRLYALEKVEHRCPPGLRRLAGYILNLDDPDMGDWINGLMSGEDGTLLQEALGLTPVDRKAFQGWLMRVLEDSGVPLGKITGTHDEKEPKKRPPVKRKTKRGSGIPPDEKRTKQGRSDGGFRKEKIEGRGKKMKVPVYERQMSPEVSKYGSGWNKPPAAAFGILEAKALQGAGRTLDDAASALASAAAEMEGRANDAAVLDASSLWTQRANEYLYHPDTGLYGRTGRDARGASGDAAKFFAELERDIFKGLDNDVQRDLFRKYIQRNALERLNGVARHERVQFDRYRADAAEKAANSAIATVTADYRDDALFDAEMDRAENALLTLLGPANEDAVTAKMREVTSVAHEARLNRWIEADPRGAESYLEKNIDMLLPERRESMRAKTERAMEEVRLEETAAGLAAKYARETDALKHIREHYSGKQERSLVTTLRNLYAGQRAETARRRMEAAAEVDREYREAPDAGSLEKSLRRRGLPEDRIAALSAQHRTEQGITADGVSGLPWEDAERELVRTAAAYGAEPDQREKMIALHREMTADRLKRREMDPTKADALDRTLQDLGVPRLDRTRALLRYAPGTGEETARLEAELRAEAETALWKEIQAGEYDTPDNGVEGKLLLRERLGALGLGKEPSERLLKEHASRFSPDRSPERDLVRSVIAAAQETLENAVTKGIFRNAALALADRFGKDSPLWKLTDDILRLKDELTGDRKDLYLPQMPAYMKTPQASWEGWTWSDEDQAYIRPTGETDDKGYPKIERWNPAQNIFLILP